MIKEKIKKIFEEIKKNQKYLWVFAVLFLVFLLNQSFPAEIVTSKSCMGGKCKVVIINPTLSDEAPFFYVNNFFKSKSNEYYRIIFQVRSNQKTAVDFFITNISDQDKKIKNFEIDKVNTDFIQEIIFKSDKEYSDLIFKKAKSSDGADILIDKVEIAKLNVKNDQELAILAPTIFGEADNAEIEDQVQEDGSYAFEQLGEPDVIFGQVFIPEMDYITNVSLDIDIIKQSNSGGKKYSLDLRNVNTESNVPDIKSNPIASLRFSIDDMEKYRQEDGKFLFPIIARLEAGKSYFIGINNDKMDVNKFNRLILRGTSDEKKYSKGKIAIKYKGDSYSAVGSLYFKTYGFKLKKYNDVNIILGSRLEDLGGGKARFSYRSSENNYELINLESVSKDIYFNESKKVLAGKIEDESSSYLTYKFETAYPIESFSFSWKLVNPAWNAIKLFYSFDNKDWIDASLVDLAGNKYQSFDFEFLKKQINKKKIFIKIEPEKDKYPDQSEFGIKDFEFKMDLITKK